MVVWFTKQLTSLSQSLTQLRQNNKMLFHCIYFLSHSLINYVKHLDKFSYSNACYGYWSTGATCDLFYLHSMFNTLRPRQNERHFADDTFNRIFLNENVRISIKISLKFVPKGPINNNPALVQIMACRRSGDKPLSEPMMVSLLTHICVTRPQWVNFNPSMDK